MPCAPLEAKLARNPSAISRLDAYWFWGPIPAEAEMREQLASFHASGFHRIYIQARFALPLETYLSNDWLSAYRKALDIMAELGLKAGLYDDYAFTSGQAGGRTVKDADHLRETHLFWTASETGTARIGDIKATLGAALGPAVRNWIHEGGAPHLGDWTLVAAVLHSQDAPPEDITRDVHLTSSDGTHALFSLNRDLPAGATWTIFASARITTSRIINYLLPEAGARFVEKGLRSYAQALGAHMGTTLDCLFYDQPAPALYDWPGRYGNLRISLPWTRELAREISCHGSLALQLAALLEEDEATPAECRDIRSRIYRSLTTQMQEAFFGPVQSFCQEYGIKLTGHEILPHVGTFALNGGFSSIDPRVALAADFFGTDLWRAETSVDANNLDAQLAPLMGDSIARASGRKGCWTELYLTSERSPKRASGQWELTPEALRGQLLRLHLLGASRIILHALYANAGDDSEDLLTNLRFDFAPGYNLQPWWPVFPELASEAADLRAFLEDASPPPQVALLYPYETALREGPVHGHAATFGRWCEALLKHGHRPLIIDEAGLLQLMDQDRLYGSRIEAIALPGPVTFRSPELAAKLQACALPVLEQIPEDIPGLFASDVPILSPTEGVRSLLAGQNEQGHWHIVFFNESNEQRTAEVHSAEGLSSPQPPSPPATLLKIELAPQELRCLTLHPAPAEIPEVRIPSRVPPLGTVHEILNGHWTLRTRNEEQPIEVARGWQAQGFPDWSGTGIYERPFTLTATRELLLELPSVACVAEVFLDGQRIGRRHHAPFRFPLGPVSQGKHSLQIAVSNTMANSYYAGTEFAGGLWPDASGLTAPPVLHRIVTTATEPHPSS